MIIDDMNSEVIHADVWHPSDPDPRIWPWPAYLPVNIKLRPYHETAREFGLKVKLDATAKLTAATFCNRVCLTAKPCVCDARGNRPTEHGLRAAKIVPAEPVQVMLDIDLRARSRLDRSRVPKSRSDGSSAKSPGHQVVCPHPFRWVKTLHKHSVVDCPVLQSTGGLL